MNIGLMIAKERTKQNLSRPKLAKQIGVSTRAVEYWESGKRNISLECLDKVLKVLNITVKLGQNGELF